MKSLIKTCAVVFALLVAGLPAKAARPAKPSAPKAPVTSTATVTTPIPAPIQAPIAAPTPAPAPAPTLAQPAAPDLAPTSPAAAAPATEGAWHVACDGDVAQFCPGITDKSAVTACLGKNTAQLSPACQQVRAKEEKRWKAHEEKPEKKSQKDDGMR